MNKMFKKLKRTNKFAKYSYYILTILYVITFLFFAKNILSLAGIETILRIILLLILILYILIYIVKSLELLLKRKYGKCYLFNFITIILICIFSFASYYISFVYNEIGKTEDNGNITYTTCLVTLNDTKFNRDSVIGRINNKDDIEGYKLTINLIKKEKLINKIDSYDNYILMLKDLLNKKIDAIFIPMNYINQYKNEVGLEELEYKTKTIKKYSKVEKNNDLLDLSNKDFNDPLTFLIMGVDSEKNGLSSNASFNGDTLMLIAINPHTLETTMVSLPRDTYVPITCNYNRYAKINSAAGKGTSCVINTVSKLLDVKIDYYAKINFKGVVDLVDAIGGVEVDVEKPDFKHHHALGINCNGKFCEQNSNRGTGRKDVIYINPGLQKLNGEEALAYARGRYLYAAGDLARIKHQQQVVEALAKKLLSKESIDDFKDILQAVSNNMITNMERSKIFTGYNVAKKMVSNAINGEEFITINKAYLETYSLNTYLQNAGMYTSALGYYKDSLDDISNSLKETLGKKNRNDIKTFEYSVNTDYLPYSPGKGKRKIASSKLLPSFIGKTKEDAENYCRNNNLKLKTKYVDSDSSYYNDTVTSGMICNQSHHKDVHLSTLRELTIYIKN